MNNVILKFCEDNPHIDLSLRNVVNEDQKCILIITMTDLENRLQIQQMVDYAEFDLVMQSEDEKLDYVIKEIKRKLSA